MPGEKNGERRPPCAIALGGVCATDDRVHALECRGTEGAPDGADGIDALCSLGTDALGATEVLVARASLMWSHSVEGPGLTYTPLATIALGGHHQTGSHA